MKKTTRKFLAILLTMVMAIGLGVTSFAATASTEGKKTVNVEFRVDSSAELANPPATVRVDNLELDENATVMDAINAAATAKNVQIEWAEDTYSKPNGWYITSVMGLSSQYIDSGKTEDGLDFYESNSMIIYQIPTEDTLNVTEDTYGNSQALTLYASNVQAVDGNTIYVVYQRTYTTW